MPQTIVAVKAGLTLHELKSVSDVLDYRMILTLFGLAFLSLLPTLAPVKRQVNKLLNKESKEE